MRTEGLLGWHQGEDAAAHHPLKTCKKKSGKQKKTCLKKAKKHNALHAAETPPFCADQPDDTFCNGGKCFQGACNPRPSCSPWETPCPQSGQPGAFCCSGLCEGNGQCGRAGLGAPCRGAIGECAQGLVCVGYRCWHHRICRAGADACQAAAPCGEGGQCFQPLGGGPTRCAVGDSAACGCTSHPQCEATHGTGAFCVTFTPGACTCDQDSTFCAVPR